MSEEEKRAKHLEDFADNPDNIDLLRRAAETLQGHPDGVDSDEADAQAKNLRDLIDKLDKFKNRGQN